MAVRDNTRKSALMSSTSTPSTRSTITAATVDQVDPFKVDASKYDLDDIEEKASYDLAVKDAEIARQADKINTLQIEQDLMQKALDAVTAHYDEAKKQIDELHAEGIEGAQIMVGRIDDQGNPTTQRYENAKAAAMALAPDFAAAVPNHTDLQPGQFTVYFRDESGVVSGENFDGLDHLINHFKTIRRDFHALDALEAGQDFAV